MVFFLLSGLVLPIADTISDVLLINNLFKIKTKAAMKAVYILVVPLLMNYLIGWYFWITKEDRNRWMLLSWVAPMICLYPQYRK